jgi:hypothetical protein
VTQLLNQVNKDRRYTSQPAALREPNSPKRTPTNHPHHKTDAEALLFG